MDNRIYRVVTLVVSMTLLAGCGGGTPTASPTPAATATPAPTPTSTPAPLQATVVDVINEVDAHALPEGDWAAAEVDMAIYQGGEVRAREASTARVGIEEDLVRVAPNTVFTFEQPDADTLRLNLDEGQVWINVEGLAPGQTFEVETPAAVASVRGTRFGVRVEPDGMTIVSTQVGTVTVSAATEMVTVTPGLVTAILPGSLPSAPDPMCPGEQVRWGMAAGLGLDVVLPVVSTTNVLTYPYSISHPGMSSGGDYFAGIYYVPLEENRYRPEPLLYDLQAALVVTATLPANASSVTFNPSGEGLAYGLHGQVCTANDDWSGGDCFGESYSYPTWSPDGEWLLFASYTGTGSDLFKARPDGSELTQLTSTETGYNTNATWSPDGSQIAYTSYADYEQPPELWVMNSDGADPRQLLPEIGHDSLLWGRDGSYLVVSGYGEGEYGHGGGLWFVPLDGSAARQTPGTEGWSCWNTTWSPTSTGWPLFFSGDSGEAGNAGGDGAESGTSGIWWLVQDSDAPTYFSSASWGPVWGGDQVAFGYVQEEPGAESQTTVYFFQTEPTFWP